MPASGSASFGRTREQIRAEIEATFGFFPPFFAPAETTPAILENLWQQTLSAYINNPLPALFKEKLFAYLSRYCSIPYCIVCHSCALRPLGMSARDILELISKPPPTIEASELHAFTEQGLDIDCLEETALEPMLLDWAIALFLTPQQASAQRQALRRLLGPQNYTHLSAFLGYICTCHQWVENYPELSYEADQRAQLYLHQLLREEPSLAHFFATYREQVQQEQQRRETELVSEIEKRKQVEALLKLTLDFTHIGTWDWDLATNKVTWNANHFRLLGLEPDGEADYQTWRDRIHPEDIQQIEQAVAHALETQTNYEMEYRVIYPDGSLHWVLAKGRGLDDESGRAVRMIGVMIDISDRKRAEQDLKQLNEELEQRVEARIHELHQINERLQAEIQERQRAEFALRQSEELLRQIFESAPIGIALADPRDYHFTMVNPAFCSMLGYSAQELLHGSCPVISYPEDLEAEKPYAERLLAGDISEYQIVKRYIRKDQQIIWGNLTARVIRNHAGEILYILGIVDDITERKQWEEALAQRTEELESLINLMPDYIYVIERETMRILLCNEAFVKGVGLGDRQQVQGKTIFECFPEKDALYFRQQNQQVFESQQTLHIQETVGLTDGPHHFETYKIPLRRLNGEIYALLGLSRDYTELIEVQHALTKRTAQLEASNRELDSFSYSVSHDLRAPLRHISGFVNALISRLEQNHSLNDPKIAHYLQVIQDSSSKMGQLIDGLLTLSRVGRRQMAALPVDLNALVQSVLTQLPEGTVSTDMLAEDSSHSIEFVLGELPTVVGDATLLQQVFANLIENAIKFSRGRCPARIEVGALADGTIFVRDNGVGFQMEYADQLFGAFQRLHSQSEFEGTGIGLAIVQRIIHRHGGMVWAESEPGNGAIFYFKLGASP